VCVCVCVIIMFPSNKIDLKKKKLKYSVR